jgi:predicted membrane-bound spermidine synthase
MAKENRGQMVYRMPMTRLWAGAAGQMPTLAPNPPVQRAALAPVAGLLFLSGVCALIFQVSWFREFRLVFGASTAASSAVLAVFMGGLGIGNAVLGKRADRAGSPLALYALLELCIATAAALSPLLIDVLHGLYIFMGGQLALGFPLATAVRLAISALVLGVPTFLMGGTLPAAVRAVTVSEDHRRRGAALLYGLNTLGAVAGALGSTFFALEFFGTRKTLWLACLVNLGTALAALVLSRYASSRSGPAPTRQIARKAARAKMHTAHDQGPVPEQLAARASRLPHTAGTAAPQIPASFPTFIVYGAAGVVGFAFFLMELVWYRMLCPILGGTTFTFGLILAVALTGIGLGGAAYAVFFRRGPISLHSLAFTSVLEACCIAIPFAWGDRLAILAATLRGANPAHFFGEVGGWAVIAAIVILPAAFVSGVQFSLLVGLLGQGDQDVGKHLGLACSWNTMGAIGGSLAGGFGLLPLLSAPGVWRSVTTLLAVLGIAVLVYARRQARRPVWAIATVAGGIAAAGMLACPGPTAVWRHGAVGAGRLAGTGILADPNTLRDWENGVRRSVLWQADGVESSVAIVASDALAFYVNGMCDGNAINDVGTQVMLGLIGGALHPQPRTAMVVGLGTGETAGWLAEVPSIEQVDVVELEPAVQEMARRCREVNRDALANAKVRLIFNDAREVLLTTAGRYDLIVCEPSNPYRNGIANLFTREFYLAGRGRLHDGGMFVQWVQAYEIDQRTMRTVLATFKSVFPQVEVWQSKRGDLVLVGSEPRPAYSESALRSKLAAEPFASALHCAWHTADLEGLFSHYVGGAALVDHFIGGGFAAVNTDDHNEIEYGFARTLGRTDWDASAALYRQSVEIGDQRPPVVGGPVDWEAAALSRAWDTAVRGGEDISADDLASIEGASDKVLERYADRDARGMLVAWEGSPHPAPCLTELAVIAHLYAESGSSKAEPLIEQLGKHLPTEAEALRGILAWRQTKVGESAERLATALRRLRSDPWVLEHIRAKTFDAAISVAQADRTQAPKLLQALGEPFAACYADEARRAAACVIAEELGPAAVAEFVESFEPHVPWSQRFLTYRQQAYRHAGHRLADQADRDLQEFVRRAAGAPPSPRSGY